MAILHAYYRNPETKQKLQGGTNTFVIADKTERFLIYKQQQIIKRALIISTSCSDILEDKL
ncbi:hypothetical protein HR13_07660 [Porphyromonas gulae]|nr:hypothetical protein HR13_07660 [Porphyromonas gulae]